MSRKADAIDIHSTHYNFCLVLMLNCKVPLFEISVLIFFGTLWKWETIFIYKMFMKVHDLGFLLRMTFKTLIRSLWILSEGMKFS